MQGIKRHAVNPKPLELKFRSWTFIELAMCVSDSKGDSHGKGKDTSHQRRQIDMLFSSCVHNPRLRRRLVYSTYRGMRVDFTASHRT